MAYEYERINNIGCVTSPISTDQAVEELQEVYRKAKILDKVLELHSQHIDTSSVYGSDLPLSANKYEYFDDGLFACEMYTLIKTYLEDK